MFPAFHSSSSGIKIPLKLNNSKDAASLINAHYSIPGNQSGMVLACPIPEEHELPIENVNAEIEKALKLANLEGVTGKATTPFILDALAKSSHGETVKASM